MPVDPMDRIERILTRWIEEDRRERHLKRAQRRINPPSESDKRIADWLRRKKKEMEDSPNNESSN